MESVTSIVLNSAVCNHCKDVLISQHRHNFVTCSCRTISVDGGRSYIKRSFQTVGDYTELSIHSDASFEVIRKNLYRGTRGPCGRQPLRWIKLSEISNNYLINLIKYCEEVDKGIDYQYYLQEKEYRSLNNIHIEE